MFEGVNILPPGHMLTVQLYTEQDALPDIEPYWQPPLTETGDDPRSEEDIAYELLAHLRWATGLNRFGAREIGIFLQGGLSSSALLALLLQQTSDQVTTFSVNLPGGFAHDEMSVIRKLRARYVTRHIDIDIDPNVPALIDRLLWLNDEPFGDAGVVMAHAAYEAMSEHVPVVLMGNGGDELFAGYEDFRIAQIARQYDRLPDIAQRAIGGAVERLPTSSSRQGVAWRISQVAQTANLSLAERYLEWIRYVPDEWFNQILGTSAATAVRRQYSTHFDLEGADGFIAPLLDVNIRVHLPYDQLVRLDHVAGAAGLNVRLPFMDHHLVQFAAGIPASLKLKRGISRYILRQALAEVLPRRVLDSRGETGLPAPVDDWFRGDVGSIAQKALLNEKAAIAGLFDTDPVHVMLEQHRSGAADLGRALWPILILELWMQRSFV
ncbi:MAG: asparagine synthetase B family protein [Anaerolineae bacterium]